MRSQLKERYVKGRGMLMNEKPHEYDVALSFAGEDRDYVGRVAEALRRRGINVFYDEYERSDLWGKDLYAHLSSIYSEKSRYVVMFISKFYEEKV